MIKKKSSNTNTFINYVLNKNTEVELIFISYIDKKNNDNSIIFYDIDNVLTMKQGEFLLLFLNADFSNDNMAQKTFFSYLSKNIREELKNFNSLNELSDFQYRLRNCINFVFEYKTYTESYENQFKDYITNAQSNMSISDKKQNITVLLDTKINEKNGNYDKVNTSMLKDFGYTHDVYFVDSIPSLLYIMLKEFTIFKTLPIRKCKNCGKFFMAQNRKDELYCNNLFEDKGKTCKQLGAMSTYIQKLEENPVLALYKNMIKRKHMRVKRNSDNIDMATNFEDWKEQAKDQYEKYKNNEITDKEFEKWLNKNE